MTDALEKEPELTGWRAVLGSVKIQGREPLEELITLQYNCKHVHGEMVEVTCVIGSPRLVYSRVRLVFSSPNDGELGVFIRHEDVHAGNDYESGMHGNVYNAAHAKAALGLDFLNLAKEGTDGGSE